MNKKITLLTMAIVIVAMLISFYKPAEAANTKGARNSVDFVWYTDVDSAYSALKAGSCDMLDWGLTELEMVDAQKDPNIQVVAYSSYSLWELDLNNNKTIATYGGGATSPTASPAVRMAIACLLDKDTDVIAGILDYYGSRIDVMVPYAQTTGWVNTSVIGTHYPYNENFSKAVDYLAGAGFWGDGTYLHYPNASWTDGLGHNGTQIWGTAAGETTQDTPGGEPLKVVIRNTDPLRLSLGRLIVARLDGGPGGPAASVLYNNPRWAHWGLKGGAFGTTGTTWEGPRSLTKKQVMTNLDYNIYTGGWTVGRYPVSQYSMFTTSFFYSNGPNYVTGKAWMVDNPNYKLEMDPILHSVFYAVDIPSSKAACVRWTTYFTKWCVNIPIWSSKSYNAWRKEITGVVNEMGYGIINDFTFMNAYKTGAGAGTPLIVGEPETWGVLNQLYAQFVFEQDYLGRIVGGTMTFNPYDTSIDQPWMAQDWTNSTWFDPGTNSTKTECTYYFRTDCGWAAPGTGNAYTRNFTSQDFAASMWYTYADSNCWQWSNTMDINHIVIVNSHVVKVYFDDLSMWFLYSPTYPILMPAPVLMADDELVANTTDTFKGSDLATPPGAVPGYLEYNFTTNSVVQVIKATVNDTISLTEDVDYHLRAGYDYAAQCVFVPLRHFNPSDKISIQYYYSTLSGAESGTMLGTRTVPGADLLPVSMWSCSYLYPVDLHAGSSLLNPNNHFFLQVPPLGEIDWRWYWTGTTPRSGYYRIDILDVVRCTGSYSHRGDGTYDPTYFPGADIDPTDLCHVGILDLVSITGKYYHTFGTPP
jgi:hypothetical protein